MKDFRKTIEDNYLTFIAITAGAVALIGVVIWVITSFIKKAKTKE